MKNIVVAIFALCSLLAFGKDKSQDYQVGTLVLATTTTDGTLTNTLHGDGTTIAGGVYANRLKTYQIRVDTGTWTVVPLDEQQDSMIRGMGMTPEHIKKEKNNPLDMLKSGERVMFRVYEHHYLNGKFTQIAIPFADNPNKEFKFSAKFVPDVAPVSTTPVKPTDNVAAMCNSGKLTADQQKQFCTQEPPAPQAAAPASKDQVTSTPPAAKTDDSRIDSFKKMCDSGLFVPGRDDAVIEQCNIMYPKK